MAEGDDFDGTLRAEPKDKRDEQNWEIEVTSVILSQICEAMEGAVEAIVLKNDSHDREKVAKVAAEKTAEIAKMAAYATARRIMMKERERNKNLASLEESEITSARAQLTEKVVDFAVPAEKIAEIPKIPDHVKARKIIKNKTSKSTFFTEQSIEGVQAQPTIAEILKIPYHVRARKIIKKKTSKSTFFAEQSKIEGAQAQPTMLFNEKHFDTVLTMPERKSSSEDENESTEPELTQQITVIHPWKKLRSLGKGAYGDVFLGEDKNGMKFAAKEVPISGGSEKALKTEIEYLSTLSHDNIVRYFGWHTSGNKMYMYMELMQGSVKDKMEKERQPISTPVARKYTKQLLRGLIYLHSKHLIHRDIKCANVLVDDTDSAKLADMGVSKVHVNITINQAAQERTGSLHWMSPEVIEGKEGGKRSDVWSVGCTVYEMVNQKPPFSEIQGLIALAQLHDKITRMQHRSLVLSQIDMDRKLKEFFLAIFVKMDDRPFADTISTHSWLQ